VLEIIGNIYENPKRLALDTARNHEMATNLTPLSWCIIASTIANVTTAGALIWFLATRPTLHIIGSVGVHGSVSVDGGTIDAKFDKDSIQKVQICEEGSELSSFPLPPDNKPQRLLSPNALL
jgi:hypothetical protein